MKKFINWYFPKRLPDNSEFTWKQPHHFYWGLIITFIGFILIFSLNSITHFIGMFLLVLGNWISIDDLIQTIIQWWLRKKNYTRVSFWHWFPYKLKGYLK